MRVIDRKPSLEWLAKAAKASQAQSAGAKAEREKRAKGDHGNPIADR
jgi:hypothetical protein